VSRGGNSLCSFIDSFLQYVAGVPARPFPLHLVFAGGAIEAFPPREVRFAAEAAAHRFDDVTRVSEHFYFARLAQCFEANRRGRDFRLLVGRVSEVFADCSPMTFVSQQSHCGCAAGCLTVTATRSVAENCYLLEGWHGYRLLFWRIFCIGENRT
jgi:hypothetical protein